jgi:hypothetical protein
VLPRGQQDVQPGIEPPVLKRIIEDHDLRIRNLPLDPIDRPHTVCAYEYPYQREFALDLHRFVTALRSKVFHMHFMDVISCSSVSPAQCSYW